MPTRVRRAQRRRRDNPPVGRTLLQGMSVIAVLGLLAFVGIRLYSGVPGRDYGTLFVSTPVIGNLLPHDSVRIGGARVGQVLSREIGKDGRPRLKLQLDPGVHVPSDTAVAFRANGLLGARYVELIPGSSAAAADDGTTLRGTEDSYTFGLPEALDIFDGDARAGLRQTIDNLGGGMLGQGASLNRSVETLGTAVKQFDRIVTEVGKRGGARRLLPALESAVAPLERNTRSWRAFNRALADAASPFVTQRDAVRATLAIGPATAASVTHGLGKGRRLLASLRGLSTETARVLPDAPGGLRELTGLLREGPSALPPAEKLLKATRPAIPGALRITDALDPLLPEVSRLVRHGRPTLEVVARYGCDIKNLGAVMRSMTGFGQPGSGPGGPYMAFRLQPVMPITTDPIGIEDPAGLLQRDGYPAPCRYLSSEYPQFVSRAAP